MFKIQLRGPCILGGILLLFGAPPEMAESLQEVNKFLGQNVCPEGEQKMFYPGETRIDRCIPKGLLVGLPCPPGNQQITIVKPLEIEGMVTSTQDTMCIPRYLTLPEATRRPLIPPPQPRFIF